MKNSQKPETRPGQALYRVLYSSAVPRLRSSDAVESDIAFILRESRTYNAKHGITGVLVTNTRMYSQVIEGPTSAVKDLIGHIACDGRHRNVRIISSHGSAERIFESWSMAFVRSNRNLEVEAFLFPSDDGQSNIMAVSAFCVAVRRHVMSGTTF